MSKLTAADRALLLHIAREHATKAVAAAGRALLDYANLTRQDVEHRLGIPAGDERALDDGTYQQILDVWASLGEIRSRLDGIDHTHGDAR